MDLFFTKKMFYFTHISLPTMNITVPAHTKTILRMNEYETMTARPSRQCRAWLL